MTERTVFLVNPASANGATGKRWPEIAHRAALEGLNGDALISARAGDITELAERAARSGADLVVVVGGDGTINEAVNGLLRVGERPELAVLAQGTGDDFIRTHAIPSGLADAIAVARDGTPRVIDVGRVAYRQWDGTPGERHFANVASAGMSGAVAQRANRTSKALGGRVTFFYALTREFLVWRNGDVTVEVAGEVRRGPMHDVVVANGAFHGGAMKLAPDAQPDDGEFDVLLIGDVSKLDFLTTAPKLYSGKHLGHPKVEVLRGPVVDVDAGVPLPLETDGEVLGTTPARFEIVPRALRVRVPRQR
ncbi:MAG: diacylglycerol/lipid kinase family protein [Gaiellaceae bacterium]